jgi:stearoyl-CoA desaturase (delta-9 desaturase)
MKLSAWAKVKLFQLAVHIIALVGAVFYWATEWFAASVCCWAFMYLFGATIGFHRLWAHRSFDTSTFVQYVTLFVGTIMGIGSVVGWVGQHRQHHAYSDVSKELDPYWAHDDYSVRGTVTAWLMTPRPIHFEMRMVKDLVRNRVAWFTHNWYFTIVTSWAALLLAIDIRAFIFCWAIPSVGCYISAQVSGVFGHRYGEVTHLDTNDQSKDCHWLNIFSFGEGYQNTHHRHPTQVVMGKYDLSGYIINRFLAIK